MSKTLKQKTAHNIVWSFLDKFGQQGIALLVGILLMRYFLSPSDYGLVAMILVIIALGNIFIDSGFSNALIRKQDVTQTSLSSVFYFNIAISVLFYLLVFFCAPLFALFFEQPILTKLARIMALSIPISAFALVQVTSLTKALNFKYIANINILALGCSGALSLFLAWQGLGVWVLVIQPLTFSAMRTLSLWCFNSWRPSAVFSMESIKSLWSYSSKLLLSSVISVIFDHIHVFFIGKIYPSKDVGYYSQAKKYSELPNFALVSAIQAVIYPVMATIRVHGTDALKKTMRKTVRVTSFVLLPVMLGLIATAEPLVHTIFATKWLPIVPYMQILCVGYLFLGIATPYNNILFIEGLSSTLLYFNIFYRILILVSILLTMHQGIAAMLFAWSIVATLYSLFLMIYAGRKINYTLLEQIKDILPYFVLALVMGAGVFLLSFWIENYVVLLLSQLIVGAAFYLGATYLFGSKVFQEIIEMVKSKTAR